jgi:hypothetical protein
MPKTSSMALVVAAVSVLASGGVAFAQAQIGSALAGGVLTQTQAQSVGPMSSYTGPVGLSSALDGAHSAPNAVISSSDSGHSSASDVQSSSQAATPSSDIPPATAAADSIAPAPKPGGIPPWIVLVIAVGAVAVGWVLARRSKRS